MSADTTPQRLLPRWFVPATLAFLGVLTVAFLVTGLVVDDGLMSRSIVGLGVVCALLIVATCSAFVRPRRRREPVVAADGTRTFLAPAATVWPIVGAVLVIYGVIGLWVAVALTDFSSLESVGFSLVALLGALAGLPDLVRLLTGRLHRWRLELGPEALTYRGYRTDLTVPWSKVGRATVQTKPPVGVLVNVRGESKDPVIPIAAFTVPPEQLVEEIERAKAARPR